MWLNVYWYVCVCVRVCVMGTRNVVYKCLPYFCVVHIELPHCCWLGLVNLEAELVNAISVDSLRT